MFESSILIGRVIVRCIFLSVHACICSIFGFHRFSQKNRFTADTVFIRKSLSRFSRVWNESSRKAVDLAKKVKIFGLGNCRESSTITCDDICFPSKSVLGDQDPHAFGPPGSGSISQMYGSGSGSRSTCFWASQILIH